MKNAPQVAILSVGLIADFDSRYILRSFSAHLPGGAFVSGRRRIVCKHFIGRCFLRFTKRSPLGEPCMGFPVDGASRGSQVRKDQARRARRGVSRRKPTTRREASHESESIGEADVQQLPHCEARRHCPCDLQQESPSQAAPGVGAVPSSAFGRRNTNVA